jgi:hypothetical protein
LFIKFLYIFNSLNFINFIIGNKTENLFKNFRKNFIYEDLEKTKNKEELKTFLNQKLDTIAQDEKMSIEEKAKSFIKEQWKAENEIIKDKIDGEIRINAYGNVEFDFFKKEENNDFNDNDNENSNNDNANNGVSNSIIIIFYIFLINFSFNF